MGPRLTKCAISTALVLILAGCLSADERATGGSSNLSDAVAAGDIERVRELAAQGADLDEPLVLGMTPLMRAVNRDDADMVGVLLESGARVSTQGADGLTAVQIAARADAIEALDLLLEAGADPSARSPSGMNALDHAADAGSLTVVETLASRSDIDIDEPSAAVTQGHGYPRDRGPTPLGLAVRAGHTQVVNRLLQLGAAVDGLSASGHTPLLLAVFFDQSPDIVERLLAAGAEIDATAQCERGCSNTKRPLTVVEWAKELERAELVPILERG